MLNQCWSANTADMKHGRMVAVRFQIGPELSAKIIGQESGNIRRAGKTDQVRHSRAYRCGAEAFGLSNRPRSHETAVAPPHDTQAIWIGDPFIDEVVHTCHEVAEIAAAPVS